VALFGTARPWTRGTDRLRVALVILVWTRLVGGGRLWGGDGATDLCVGSSRRRFVARTVLAGRPRPPVDVPRMDRVGTAPGRCPRPRARSRAVPVTPEVGIRGEAIVGVTRSHAAEPAHCLSVVSKQVVESVLIRSALDQTQTGHTAGRDRDAIGRAMGPRVHDQRGMIRGRSAGLRRHYKAGGSNRECDPASDNERP
jgi:hypothetical protein